MATIEIQTTEGGRLEWVAIYQNTDERRAIEWGDMLLYGFKNRDYKPNLRILDRPMGKVIGAWQAEGYDPEPSAEELRHGPWDKEHQRYADGSKSHSCDGES